MQALYVSSLYVTLLVFEKRELYKEVAGKRNSRDNLTKRPKKGDDYLTSRTATLSHSANASSGRGKN